MVGGKIWPQETSHPIFKYTVGAIFKYTALTAICCRNMLLGPSGLNTLMNTIKTSI